MRMIRRLLVLLPALTACGGAPASAQPPAPSGAGTAESAADVMMSAAAALQEVPPFIEVSGLGSVEVSPDVAEVSFAAETRSRDAADASQRNAEVMDAVVRALRGSGVADLEIETFGYSLAPEYGTRTVDGTRTRVVEGYRAVNFVRVTADDVAAVGSIIDTAIGAGANRVASLQFRASSTDEAQREALAQAVRRARAQAETIASALGHELGAPLEIRGGSQSPPRYAMARAELAAGYEEAAPTTPIAAGDQTVTASVTIRFALGPEGEG